MINCEGATLYELNAKGVNRWYAGVQAGHDDFGNRTTRTELKKIAVKLSAVDELYEALNCIDFDDGMIAESLGEDLQDKISAALAKARGES